MQPLCQNCIVPGAVYADAPAEARATNQACKDWCLANEDCNGILTVPWEGSCKYTSSTSRTIATPEIWTVHTKPLPGQSSLPTTNPLHCHACTSNECHSFPTVIGPWNHCKWVFNEHSMSPCGEGEELELGEEGEDRRTVHGAHVQ